MKIRVAGLLAAATLPTAVALTLVGIAPASGSPARAKRLPCHASMSNSHPADYTTTDVRVRTGDHARVVTVAHYRTVNHKKVAHANGHGRATIPYYISGATPGYTVQVTVSVTRGRRSGSCSTSFTPHSATATTKVAFVQADDTGTINGNTTSIGSGQSNQVLAHDTGIGHSVVLMIQTLTYPNVTETDTVTSVTSGMGTFHFVNSYNDGADYEIWVCTDTTGAADTVTVTTPTNAWDAFAVEFNAPATGYVNGGGQVFDNLPYLGDQSWTVSPAAAGNVAVVGVDTDDAYNTGPAAPWTYYNSGYWSFLNGTSAAWQVAPSSAPLTATWQTDGGESSSQGVVLEF
jgi:hypothetical protein